jgi:hypothetical protein
MFDDLEQEGATEVVQYEHPLHGMLEGDFPVGMSDEAIRSEFDQVDLDLMLGLEQSDEQLGDTNVDKIKEFENASNSGLREGKWFSHNSLEGGTDSHCLWS